jgi:transcriptional regulator with XRE-family HTH domain
MRTELGDLVRRTRTSQRLTPQELARRVGYRNANKGARRLEQLERRGVEAADFIDRVASSLGIDRERVAELAARDEAARRADFEAWLRVPQPMALYQYVAGITIQAPLPEGLSEQEAVAHARELQKKQRLRVCLVLDRRRSLWITSDGESFTTEATPDSPNFPYTTLG